MFCYLNAWWLLVALLELMLFITSGKIRLYLLQAPYSFFHLSVVVPSLATINNYSTFLRLS